MLGITLWNGATSTPAVAAMAAETPITIEYMRSDGMPMYWAASASCEMARIAGAEARELQEDPQAGRAPRRRRRAPAGAAR